MSDWKYSWKVVREDGEQLVVPCAETGWHSVKLIPDETGGHFEILNSKIKVHANHIEVEVFQRLLDMRASARAVCNRNQEG